jgi:hypothetical protein
MQVVNAVRVLRGAVSSALSTCSSRRRRALMFVYSFGSARWSELCSLSTQAGCELRRRHAYSVRELRTSGCVVH